MRYICVLLFFVNFIYGDAHIFNYHRFDDYRYQSTNISTKKLIQNFEYLKKHNYEVVPLEKLLLTINSGQPVPNNWVVLTIDDGYKSFYNNGLEIFKKYNYPFTLFIYIKAIESNYGDFLTKDMIKEISKFGDIQLHGYSHANLVNMSNDEIKKDFTKAINFFEKNLGYRPKCISYPYGYYSNRVNQIAKENGFECILTQNYGAVFSQTKNIILDRSSFNDETKQDVMLAIEYLDVNWTKPLNFPKNGFIDDIKANLSDKNIKKAKLFISGYGWKNVDIIDGTLNFALNKPIKKDKFKIILKAGKKENTNFIIKDKYVK